MCCKDIYLCFPTFNAWENMNIACDTFATEIVVFGAAMGIGGSGDPNLPDHYTGLSWRQKVAVHTIWKQVQKDRNKHSVKIYVRFFDKYPQYRKYFTSEGGVPMTKLAENPHVQSHFRAIVWSITSLINAVVSNPKKLDDRVDYLALMHKDMGLTLDDFNNFCLVLVLYLKLEFPLQMGAFEIRAWIFFLTSMFKRICARMEELLQLDKMRETQKKAETEGKKNERKMSKLKRMLHFKKKRETIYLEERRKYWTVRKEMWEEEELDSDSEQSKEVKDIGTMIAEAVSLFFGGVTDEKAMTDILQYEEEVMEPGPQPPRSSAPHPDRKGLSCISCSSARARRRSVYNKVNQ